MIIYNVTSTVDNSVKEEWLEWIKEHIPQVLGTGKFTEAKLSKVLVKDDMEGETFSVQYRARSREALDSYYSNFAEALRGEAQRRFADKVLSFRTELEIIDEYSVSFEK